MEEGSWHCPSQAKTHAKEVPNVRNLSQMCLKLPQMGPKMPKSPKIVQKVPQITPNGSQNSKKSKKCLKKGPEL